MCALNGIVFFDQTPSQGRVKKSLQTMQRLTKPRGPDQSQEEYYPAAALGHNRLSIISPQEKQATVFSDQRYSSLLNGEIVNHKRLRDSLSSTINSRNDGAIIVPMLEQYGPTFIKRLAGMFAIVVYDKQTHTLHLWRDPLGIKPLYYYHDDSQVIFSSEIKAIYAVLESKPEIDFAVADHILRHRFPAGNQTIFPGINKVLPGEHVVFKNGRVTYSKYWDMRDNPLVSDPDVTIESFQEHFAAIMSEYTDADVKGGFFTSGGLDSSFVTSLALSKSQHSFRQPISMNFKPNSFIDEKYGKQLESYLGVPFDWITITDKIARETMLEVASIIDEPIENPIHVGTYLMAKRAKELGLKSVITGDGSDEFFLGYDRHEIWFKDDNPAAKYSPLNWTLSPEDEKRLYRRGVDALRRPLVNGAGQPIELITNMTDALRYERAERLPEYHNMRLDRMTMVHGIEARVPFLDHRIVEQTFRLSTKDLFGTSAKDFLKAVSLKWLPEEVVYREKVRFPGLPDQWLDDEGIEMIKDILLSTSAFVNQWFRPETLESFIQEHSSGSVRRGRLLWALTILELWSQNVKKWSYR